MKKQTYILKNHQEEQTDITIKANFQIQDKNISINFTLTGEINPYIFNPPRLQTRKDELWKESCFELFLAHKNSPNYYELNISPSTEWNFYSFSDYKTDMKPNNYTSTPFITSSKSKNEFRLSFDIELDEKILGDNLIFNLAVILLDKNGTRHFYSINRKDGNVNFHDRRWWNIS